MRKRKGGGGGVVLIHVAAVEDIFVAIGIILEFARDRNGLRMHYDLAGEGIVGWGGGCAPM